MSDLIHVSTVVPTEVPAGMLAIVATTRATKGKEIPEADRCRAILIPEFVPNVSDKYVSLVSSALATLAKDQLSALWKESNPVEVSAALFTEDALLAYAAREADSKRLTKESIEAWWNESQFKKFCTAKYGERAKNILARLQNLAAPKPDYTEDQATQALALFGAVEMEESDEMMPRLIDRLQSVLDGIKKRRESLSTEEAAPF